MMKTLYTLLVCLFLGSCSSLPADIKPVAQFELDRYLGKWYEIARLDHRFERGLDNVSATYSMNDDGSVRVVNKGYQTRQKKWEEAVGRAKFAGDPATGHLKVSFFWFFYGNYVIFGLDKKDYQYAFVSGSDNTLWFLSRTPVVSDDLKAQFIKFSEASGYNTSELIFVRHD